MFRVASAIDSMVVGEPQILGQVKDAYREATDAGAAGAVLSRLFQRAFATAKRVKNETGIAQRPVSVARTSPRRSRASVSRRRTFWKLTKPGRISNSSLSVMR